MQLKLTVKRGVNALVLIIVCLIPIIRFSGVMQQILSDAAEATMSPKTGRAFSASSHTAESKHRYCLENRGRKGYWIQDWDYANRSSYKVNGSFTTWHVADQNFTATPNQPFRRATSYRWADEECTVAEVNREDFCDACKNLGIHRVLVLGDSLSSQFMQSFRSLLGFPMPKGPASRFHAQFKPWNLECTPSGTKDISVPFTVTFHLFRLSPLSDWTQLIFHNQHLEAYRTEAASTNKTTVMLANLGAWMHNRSEYETGLKAFIDWLSTWELSRGNVVPFFRPAIPGHLGCQPFGEKGDEKMHNWKNEVKEEPYRDYEEYRNDQNLWLRNISTTKQYRWPEMEGWNNLAFNKLKELEQGNVVADDNRRNTGMTTVFDSNQYNKSSGGSSIAIPFQSKNDDGINPHSKHHRRIKVYWLNIFDSGVLRRDGHIGFGDCLHYYMPGPIDWWAHFFHSALLDLSAISMKNKA